MSVILPFRRWVARYGRWIATVGWLLMIDGFWNRRYDHGAVGLLIGALAAWGMLLDADQPGKTRAFQRKNLTSLMWWGIVGGLLVTAFVVWVRLDPEG